MDMLHSKNLGNEGGANYVPHPRITFLVDNPKLTCIICQESALEYKFESADRDEYNDTTPAILPCGHVFGWGCLTLWLESHDSCPSCRLKLSYELCDHRVQPRPINQAQLPFVPEIGGPLPDQCKICRMKTSQVCAQIVIDNATRSFQSSRRKYEKSKSKKDEAIMKAHAKYLEEMVAKSFAIDPVLSNLREW
jgi:hypothetical protein